MAKVDITIGGMITGFVTDTNGTLIADAYLAANGPYLQVQ